MTTDTTTDSDPSPPDRKTRMGQVIARGEKCAEHTLVSSLLLVLLSALCFWPGQMTLPPTDRDEARYVQATKQMIQTGDFVDIRFQEQPRHKKPAGIHWLQTGALAAYGHITGVADPRDAPLWVYRLPSFLGAVLAVLFTHMAGRALFGPFIGLTAGVLMTSVIMIGIEANIAKTDAMLLATIVGAQAILARWWMADGAFQPSTSAAPLAKSPASSPANPPRWTAYFFWVAMGVGFMVKGPIIVMVVGLTVLALLVSGRRLRWLYPAGRPLAVLLGLLIAVPWYILIYQRAGMAFFEHAVGTDLLGKITEAQESHGAPPGVYVLAAFGTLWPIVAFVPETFSWLRRRLKEPAILFCLCWIAPTWLAFEAFSTKLPHYVLPTYPAFAILIAAAFRDGAGFGSLKWRRIARLPLLIAPIGLMVVVAILGRMLGGEVPWAALLALAGTVGLSAFLWWMAAPVRLTQALLLSLGTALAFIGALHYAAPMLDRVWISNALVARATGAANCEDPRIITIGYNEPSLVFLSRADVAITSPDEPASTLIETDCQLLVVDRRFEEKAVAEITSSGFDAAHQGEVLGLNYNGGDELELQLYRLTKAGG